MAKKGGRKPWIPSTDELKQIEQYAALGLTQEQIARCMGKWPQRFCEKKNSMPEFTEALNNGRARGVANAAAKLLKNINTGKSSDIIFYLKTKGGWKEEINIEHHNHPSPKRLTRDKNGRHKY